MRIKTFRTITILLMAVTMIGTVPCYGEDRYHAKEWEYMYESEPYESIRIEDGIAFAQETYVEYLSHYAKDSSNYDANNYQAVDHTAVTYESIEEVERLTLADPFIIYEIDGVQQPACLYFPIYDRDEFQYIILFDVEFENGRWHYGTLDPGEIVMYEEFPAMFEQVDYLNEECIAYSINAEIYLESKKACVKLTPAQTDIEGFSMKELAFMNMDFEKKKETVNNGLQTLCAVEDYQWNETEYCRRLIGTGDDILKPVSGISIKEEKNEAGNNSMAAVAAAGGCAVLLIGMLGIILYKKKHR